MKITHQFRYLAFGLRISSELEIPELLPGDILFPEDVKIYFEKTPPDLTNATFKGVRFQAAPDELLLKADNIANYYVKNGDTIIIEPHASACESDIRLFLLGSAMGALIHQRGMLPFHGSAIIHNSKAYIFSGISGAGKSTLAASLNKQGFPLIADDICAISLNSEKKPIVNPGYPQMKLWADSLEKLGEKNSNLQKIREGIQKYAYPLLLNFVDNPHELRGIYILTSKNSDGFQVDLLKGIEKFNTIKNNTYRLNFLKGTGNTPSHFEHINSISGNCIVKRIVRPSKGFSLAELTDIVVRDILETENL